MEYKPAIPVYIQVKDDIIEKIRQGKWLEDFIRTTTYIRIWRG